LLAIALVAVLIGILFLYLEMGVYDFDFQGGPKLVKQWAVGSGPWAVIAFLIPSP
jgi:uncharacterized membrane protein YdjX (TVP38/TMEM64 family)